MAASGWALTIGAGTRRVQLIRPDRVGQQCSYPRVLRVFRVSENAGMRGIPRIVQNDKAEAYAGPALNQGTRAADIEHGNLARAGQGQFAGQNRYNAGDLRITLRRVKVFQPVGGQIRFGWPQEKGGA